MFFVVVVVAAELLGFGVRLVWQDKREDWRVMLDKLAAFVLLRLFLWCRDHKDTTIWEKNR